MDGGEGETSILLHYSPSSVGADWESADHKADERPDLLMRGMRGYTKSGIIGWPSLATAEKCAALVRELVAAIDPRLAQLRR